MINTIRHYILILIDWKISLLEKFKKLISGEYKYTVSDKDWLKNYKIWKKQND